MITYEAVTKIFGTGKDAIVALENVSFDIPPGKVVVFPQIRNLPLMSLKEVEEKLPEVASKLGEDLMWTNEAEEVLIEKFWQKPE